MHAQHALGADSESEPAWQAESMEDVDRRLDGLAQSGRLDPAFMLTMSNAYANTKLTDATKEEVKDIMYYMYQQVCCRAEILAGWQATAPGCTRAASEQQSMLTTPVHGG